MFCALRPSIVSVGVVYRVFGGGQRDSGGVGHEVTASGSFTVTHTHTHTHTQVCTEWSPISQNHSHDSLFRLTSFPSGRRRRGRGGAGLSQVSHGSGFRDRRRRRRRRLDRWESIGGPAAPQNRTTNGAGLLRCHDEETTPPPPPKKKKKK